MYKPCKVCKNSDQGLFVEDHRHGDIICTVCGSVQMGINISMNNTTFSEPILSIAPNKNDKKLLGLNDQMMKRVYPKEYRDFKRTKTIEKFCEILELPTSVVTRTELLLTKHEGTICKIRPIDNLIASCIILSCQIINKYINVNELEQWLDISNVNTTLKMVCKAIGVNQRAIVLNSVPFLVSSMSLPFKFEKKLQELYKTTSRKNPSMGSETRMALCCYKLYNDNLQHASYKHITLAIIAKYTNTSENSLKSYVTGKTKNSLFEKQKSLKRSNIDNDNDSNKKIKNI